MSYHTINYLASDSVGNAACKCIRVKNQSGLAHKSSMGNYLKYPKKI